jgi:hypothetical protein
MAEALVNGQVSITNDVSTVYVRKGDMLVLGVKWNREPLSGSASSVKVGLEQLGIQVMVVDAEVKVAYVLRPEN